MDPLTPMLAVHECGEALDFYSRAFGATEEGERHEFKGKIGHARFRAFGAELMIADEFPPENTSPKSLGGTTVILHVEVDDVDAKTERAKAAGAEVIREPTNYPYGRISKIRDPYGHVWMLNQR